MDENLAYSVFVESKTSKDEPLRYTLPKRVHKWVDDNTVATC